MDDKVVVITGGNSGIGLETAVALAGAGARIVLGCRNPVKADAAVADIRQRSGNEAVESRRLDLADLESVSAFADSLADLDRIDVLINNAGLTLNQRQETAQGFEATFGINHLGHFLLTNLVLDQIRAAPTARIVNLSSHGHVMAVRGISYGDLDRERSYQGWLVYGESKLANLLHVRALAQRLQGTAITTYAVHPGAVATKFGQDGDVAGWMGRLMDIGVPLMNSPANGARTPIHVASSPSAQWSSGDYWVRSKVHRASRAARAPGAPEQLWAVSERMIASAGIG